MFISLKYLLFEDIYILCPFSYSIFLTTVLFLYILWIPDLLLEIHIADTFSTLHLTFSFTQKHLLFFSKTSFVGQNILLLT